MSQENDSYRITENDDPKAFVGWLRNQYDDAKKTSNQVFCWCLDLKKEVDTCLLPSGLTVEQMRDDIEKKNLPLRILRVFDTTIDFDIQVQDL